MSLIFFWQSWIQVVCRCFVRYLLEVWKLSRRHLVDIRQLCGIYYSPVSWQRVVIRFSSTICWSLRFWAKIPFLHFLPSSNTPFLVAYLLTVYNSEKSFQWLGIQFSNEFSNFENTYAYTLSLIIKLSNNITYCSIWSSRQGLFFRSLSREIVFF